MIMNLIELRAEAERMVQATRQNYEAAVQLLANLNEREGDELEDVPPLDMPPDVPVSDRTMELIYDWLEHWLEVMSSLSGRSHVRDFGDALLSLFDELEKAERPEAPANIN
jgi:hypothetical protein